MLTPFSRRPLFPAASLAEMGIQRWSDCENQGSPRKPCRSGGAAFHSSHTPSPHRRSIRHFVAQDSQEGTIGPEARTI